MERIWSRDRRSIASDVRLVGRNVNAGYNVPYFEGPDLFKSHSISSPFRALVMILWLNTEVSFIHALAYVMKDGTHRHAPMQRPC